MCLYGVCLSLEGVGPALPSSYNKSNSSWQKEAQANELTHDAASSSTDHCPEASTDGARAPRQVPFSSFQGLFFNYCLSLGILFEVFKHLGFGEAISKDS